MLLKLLLLKPFMTCSFVFFISGLPFFNPSYELTMSRSAYASSLRGLGGVFKTKGLVSSGGSGSVGNQEGGGDLL